MSRPQVTITLGRSGQKVVKRPITTSDSPRPDSHHPVSGTKRSVRDRLDTYNDGTSMSAINKRLRGSANTRTPGSTVVEGVGQNDLRLKLVRKRLSRRIQQEVEEQKKTERRQKMTRTILSSKGQDRENQRQIPPERRTEGLSMMDPLRTYSSRGSERNPEFSDKGWRVSPPRNIGELPMTSSLRAVDASRTRQLGGGDVSEPYRSNRPTTITMRSMPDADKRVSELLPTSGGASGSSYMGERPQTVTSLLHSLGLGKYAVQFQAEEVDMTVLRQMGDSDLKELGIPMGPRKKILLAVMPPPKTRQFVASTY